MELESVTPVGYYTDFWLTVGVPLSHGGQCGTVEQPGARITADYRNPNIVEIMLNFGYVNNFGSCVNTVSTLLYDNGSFPVEFLLGDYTTFKVVVKNADVIENVTNSVTNNVTNGTMRNTGGTMRNNGGTIRNNEELPLNIQDLILTQIRKDKRISIKQLSNMFNKTRASIFRIIEKLKSDGKLRRVGPLKSGTWEVVE